MNNPNPPSDIVAGNDDAANRMKVREDASGRYCINDLHAAAGGLPSRDPSIYLGLTQTQELIMVMREQQGANSLDPIATPGGPGGPTFVSDILAIDYTAWISPQMRRAVFGGFRAQRERSIGGEADITSIAEGLEEAMEQAREISERAGATNTH